MLGDLFGLFGGVTMFISGMVGAFIASNIKERRLWLMLVIFGFVASALSAFVVGANSCKL